MPTSLADRYEKTDGIHVLRLSGDDYEMGHQHGTLLRDAIARGPLPHFARYVERMFGTGLLGPLGRPLARGVGFGLGATVGARIASNLPAQTRAALDGLADGARIPRRELLRAVTMPETYLWLLFVYKRLVRSAPAPRFGVPLFGCTSAIARREATTHGRLLHGRNFDYQGVGSWDCEQAVVFHDPSDGQRYVSITAAGILLGGITAMNESGLALAVHQHVAADDFDLGGTPIGVAGDAIMRHARDLDDARRILDDHVPNGAWTYVVSSARENAVLGYEVTSKRRAVLRPATDTFAYSNVYLDGTFDGVELYFYPTYWRNNLARFRRATALLEQRRGALDENAIARILGDVGDAGCRFGGAISMLMTVASVVFDAERGLVHVATGRAPVSNNPYVAFDLARRARVRELAPLDGGTTIEARAREGFDAYRAAYEAAFHQGDDELAARLVDRARAADARQPVYHFVAGLLALSRGDAPTACAAFDAAIALGHPDPERVAGFHLWRGRAKDREGDRKAALRDYREAIVGDPAVRTAAQKGLARPWRGAVGAIEWSFGEVVTPG